MKQKILLLNLGYFSGVNGSKWGYILKSDRYIKPPKKTIKEISELFKKLVVKEKPNIICLSEIRKNQIEYLTNRDYKFFDFETKYSPKGLAKMTTVLKNQCNGFMAREKIEFEKFFVKHGRKKLGYFLKLPNGINIIFFHFALSKRVRQRQFLEIKKKLEHSQKTIVCGDFNIFKGLSELNSFVKKTGLKIADDQPTFPAFKPKKVLDLFLVPKHFKARAKVITKAKLSDHLPVLLELET